MINFGCTFIIHKPRFLLLSDDRWFLGTKIPFKSVVHLPLPKGQAALGELSLLVLSSSSGCLVVVNVKLTTISY